MIKYNLTCECKCTFDSWFANSQEFERLRRNNLITCIECSSNKIKKSIMAPSVSNLKKSIMAPSISKKNNLQFNKAVGIIYNPLLDKWNTVKDTSVNYITYFIKK